MLYTGTHKYVMCRHVFTHILCVYIHTHILCVHLFKYIIQVKKQKLNLLNSMPKGHFNVFMSERLYNNEPDLS